jgi:hypothetical protein
MNSVKEMKCNSCSCFKPENEMKKPTLCKKCSNEKERERYRKKQEIFLKEIEEGRLTSIKCSKCKVEKNISNFCKNFRNCKDCSSNENKKCRINNSDNIKAKQDEKNNMEVILCPGCKIEKDRDEYSNMVNYCKECTSNRNKNKYKSNSENIKEKERLKRQYKKENKIKPDISHKKCTKCDVLKEVENFSFSFSGGYQTHCNECRKEEAQLYRDTNKEKINELQRERYKVKPRQVNSLLSKLRRSVSKYILLEEGSSKTKEAKELLGIKPSLFQDWIKYNCDIDNLDYDTKNNTWHLDHIIPCNQFKITSDNIEDIKACFHWTNMMPLNAVLNMSKQDKIIKEQIINVKDRLIKFIKLKRLNQDIHMIYWNSYFNNILEKIPNKNKLETLNRGRSEMVTSC